MTPLDTSQARSDAPPVPSTPPLRASAQPGEHARLPALTAWQSIAGTIARVAERLRALTFPRLDERALIALVREPQFAPHLLANVSYAQEHPVRAGLLNRQADAHASYALRLRPLDGALWRLRGRLAFETHRLDEAETMLQKAIVCGFPRMRVAPYLAEIAYLRRDYAAVRRCFDDLPPVPPNLLAPAAAYWTM